MPLNWHSIHNLLLCWMDEAADVQVLVMLLHILSEALPHVRMTLLISSVTIQTSNIQIITCQKWSDYSQILGKLSSNAFDAAVMLTTPGQSPYSIAYLCYLAAIPVRIGQSQEFGGGVLSHCIPPLLEPVSSIDYHLHLLRSSDIPIPQHSDQSLKSNISYAVTNFNLAHSR